MEQKEKMEESVFFFKRQEEIPQRKMFNQN